MGVIFFYNMSRLSVRINKQVIWSCILSMFFSVFLVQNLYSEPQYNLYTSYLFYTKGLSAEKAGFFREAIIDFNHALRLGRNRVNFSYKMSCLINLGFLYWSIGEIQQSYEIFEEACQMGLEGRTNNEIILCFSSLEIIRLYNIGKILKEQNKDQESISSFMKAISIAKIIGRMEFEIKCLRQQSLTYLKMNDNNNFHECNKIAYKKARAINHYIEQGRCLNNIGIYYKKITDYPNALKNFELALNILKLDSDCESEADCLNNIGLVYKEIGDFERALLKLNNALQIDTAANNYEAALITSSNISSTYFDRYRSEGSMKDLYNSLRIIQKCLNINYENIKNPVKIALLNNIGVIYFELNNNDKARDYFLRALNMLRGETSVEIKANIFINLGNLFKKNGMTNDAMWHYKSAIQLLHAVEDTSCLWEAYYGLGKCFEQDDNYKNALRYYNCAIDSIEQTRNLISIDIFKTSFIRNKYCVYDDTINSLYELYLKGQKEITLKSIVLAIEKARARSLMENMFYEEEEINIKNRIKRQKDELSNNISFIIGQLSKDKQESQDKEKMMQQLERAEEEYYWFLSNIEISTREMKASLFDQDILDPNNIIGIIRKRCLILEYWIGEKRTLLCCLNNEEIEIYELPGREQIDSNVRGYLRYLASPSNSTLIGLKAAEKIGRQLLGPIKHRLNSEVTNLIIIPDGILHYLPFESLRLSENIDQSFLIEKYIVSYAPSIRAIRYYEKELTYKKRNKVLLAIGAPNNISRRNSNNANSHAYYNVYEDLYNLGEFNLSTLPYSKREIREISKYFAEKQRDILLGSDANETILKSAFLDQYRIIHFACHALLDERHPQRSALVLSPNEESLNDGYLQVREIVNIKITTDLVMLSACQTGLGKLERGEGLNSITRAFLFAGARSVISTLWSIPDKTTSIFIKHFYKYLVEGASKSAALRYAKIEMIKSAKAHPFYWASFVLYGNYSSGVNSGRY